MSTIYSQFKTSFISGVFALSAKNIWSYLIIAAIQFGVTIAVILPIQFMFIDTNLMREIANDPESWSRDIQSNPEMIGSMFLQSPNPVTTVIVFLLVGLVLTLFSSWITNLALTYNDAIVRTGQKNFSEAFSKSFSSRVFRIFGLSLVLTVVYIVLYLVLLIGTALIHPALIVLGIIALFVIMARLIIALPAMVHGDMSIGDSISLSFKYITWKRAFILFIAGIGAMIALFVAMIIVSFILGILMFIPILGFVIYLAGMLMITSFIISLSYSLMSGLYFRYTEVEISGEMGDNIEDHLITRTN